MTQPTEVFKLLENRILTHYPAAAALLEGKMPAPRTAIVYPTYVCNQNCLWCEYSAENSEHHSMMSNDNLRKLIGDLYDLGVRGTEFCGGGEPTLHPMLAEIIREMKLKGMSSGLLTNGSRLKGDLAEAVVDCSSYVRVGFDGSNAKTFDRVKRPRSPEASFDGVCENVRNIIALRAESDGKVLISIKVILSGENYNEVESCVELAMHLGVDSIQFKAARLCENELNPEQVASVKSEMARVRSLYPEMAIVGGVDKLAMTKQCWLTPLQIMVDALGEVFLCCYYRHRKDSHCFGNAFTQPLSDIWYGQRHWDAIAGIKPTECNLLDCRFVHYNRIMSLLLKEHDAQFEFI